jgi:hypothetical protein
MASRPLVRGVLIGSLALTLSSTSLAEPSAADKETARRLMAEGRDRRGQNDQKGALQAFMAADAIMHVPTTGLEVARTQMTLGQLIEARDTSLRVARSNPEPDEPPPFTRAREEARLLSDDLAKKIPAITVQLSGAEPNAQVHLSVDGAQIPPASVGLPRTVNPGHHVVVGFSGKREAKVEVDVGEAEQKSIPLELKEPAAPVPPEQPKPLAAPARPGKPLMIGGFAVGALGLVVGSVAGLVSLSKTSSIKSGCSGHVCPSSQASNIDSAKSAATISNVGFAFAIVGAAAGVVGYLLWRGEQNAAPPAQSGLRVRPWLGPGSGGVAGAF